MPEMNISTDKIDNLLQRLEVRSAPAERLSAQELLECTEVSDPEQVCPRPLVSVHVLTYNHEPWIAQAIESVVCQTCDFPFEVIIGEDGSSDGTRAVCLAYQRKYPGIIRVLFSEQNVGVRKNSFRVLQRARGEYLALLEGDDYWVDTHKLQKQVQVMRECPDAYLSVANTRVLNTTGNFGTPDGFIYHAYTQDHLLGLSTFQRHYLHTSTYFLSRKGLEALLKITEAFTWYDSIVAFCFSSLGPVPYVNEVVSVYRVTDQGIFTGASDEKRLKQEVYVDLVLSTLTGNPYFGQRFSWHAAQLMKCRSWSFFKRVRKGFFLLTHWIGPLTLRMAFDLFRGLFCPWLTLTRR